MTVAAMASSDQQQQERRLFIGNLFPEVTEIDMQKLLSRYGKVRSLKSRLYVHSLMGED